MSYARSRSKKLDPMRLLLSLGENSGLLVGLIIAAALLSFEIFNYSTTDFALQDLLGNLRFAGIRWSTTLSIAFCAIDFAGIIRLFAPDKAKGAHKETWYLFGAWMLAATMNAMLTWWGVSMAIVNHTVMSTAVVDASTILTVVPIFVAMMVWLIRILIIGSISMAGNYFLYGDSKQTKSSSRSSGAQRSSRSSSPAASIPGSQAARSASSQRSSVSVNGSTIRPEPTYHNVSGGARNKSGSTGGQRQF